MWMSRVERKKIEKKSKKHFKVYFFFMVIVLIFGLITVDFQVRGMLAIDESGLIGYKQLGNNQYVIQILGNNHLIDTTVLRSQIDNKFAEFGEIAYTIKTWIENKW